LLSTNQVLTLVPINFSHAGSYTVIASNFAGSVTNPALVTVWSNSAARLSAFFTPDQQKVVFQVAGVSNRAYRIETTTNLTPSPPSWLPVYTNLATFLYTNINSPDVQRFFRAITNDYTPVFP
jgi:hypothetical protein